MLYVPLAMLSGEAGGWRMPLVDLEHVCTLGRRWWVLCVVASHSRKHGCTLLCSCRAGTLHTCTQAKHEAERNREIKEISSTCGGVFNWGTRFLRSQKKGNKNNGLEDWWLQLLLLGCPKPKAQRPSRPPTQPPMGRGGTIVSELKR